MVQSQDDEQLCPILKGQLIRYRNKKCFPMRVAAYQIGVCVIALADRLRGWMNVAMFVAELVDTDTLVLSPLDLHMLATFARLCRDFPMVLLCDKALKPICELTYALVSYLKAHPGDAALFRGCHPSQQ
jgi:hypothetical protein